MTMLSMNTGNRTHAKSERGNDLYETPGVATRALAQFEQLPRRIWEPSCGPGAIVRELQTIGHEVYASDLIDYGWGQNAVRDFFAFPTPDIPMSFDAIIMNPPFKDGERFVFHALDLCPRVYVLNKLTFLEGKRWERGLSGKLRKVWAFSPRLPMVHRHGWTGPRNENPAFTMAWYCFDEGVEGREPTIGWINPREIK